jgi:alternate signal-mediated exported protein
MSRKKLIITAIILALVLAIGGILAYFTDVEQKENKFKTSKVDIEVTEPSWPNVDPDDPVEIVPGMAVAKDPIVTNLGEGNVYAFVEVTIPKATVSVGNAAAALQELFTTQYISDATTTPKTYSDGINPAWVLVSSRDNAATATEPASITYVYAYGTKANASAPIVLTAIAENASTAPVFDQVTFKDVNEDDASAANSIQGKDYEVIVTGYGIQTDGLPDGATAAQIFTLAKGE